MRATKYLWPLLALACMTAGCSSARWTWRSPVVTKSAPADAAAKTETALKPVEKTEPKADGKPVPPETKVADAAKPAAPAETPATAKAPEKTAGDAAAVASKDHPFQPSRPEKVDQAAAAPIIAVSGSDEGKTPANAGPAGLQKDLLVLIDRELQDATPAERDEWFAKLKQVDPALVPDILRARRLSLQAAQSRMDSAQQFASTAPAQPAAQNPNNPWGTAGDATLSDPFGVVPVNHTATDGQQGVVRADYTDGGHTRPQIGHAVHRVDAGQSSQPIVLQNYETNTAPNPNQAPPAYQGQGPGAEPRSLPMTTAAQLAGVPWPPARQEPVAPNGLGAVTSHLPFGSNLVQNVVGLVPGRGTTTANVPVGPITTAGATLPVAGNFSAQLDQTTAFLEQEVATLSADGSPEARVEYVRKHVALRLLYLMGNHQERALTAIPGLPPAEQEFWQQMLWGMVNSLDVEHIPRASDRATQTISQLNGAIRRLQEQADLQIRHVAFCHQILYFGNYEKLPRNEFSPGQEALLYAEIDNFKSDPTPDGQYRTLLRSTIEILSPSGELRKQIDFPATEDLCSTYRRDYFHNYQFRVPERMPLGPHVLKLTVFDELSGKLSSYTVNFLVK